MRATLAVSGLLVACTRPPAAATHTLVFGGDVTLGRNVNTALHDPTLRARLFADVGPLLREADIAVVNAEGVISGGGRFYDKGESRPYTYRAHPSAMDVLAEAGIDILAAGNNHANDYGPWALREMMDRASTRGIQVVGAGGDATDARRPAYVSFDDLVVAFVGADLTYGEKHQATEALPGTFWLPGLDKKRREEVVNGLRPPLEEARQHADLVFLTPHWGDNWEAAPTPHIQALARDLIGLGYDGILGHSAHVLQGIGRIDNKPVLYDAGNLLSDYSPPAEHRASALFRLHLGPDGVTKVEAIPLTLRTNQVVPSSGKALAKQQADLIAKSAELDVVVTVDGDAVQTTLSPEGAWRRPERSPAPPPRTPPDAVREAPAHLWVDALPETATPTRAVWPGGLELVGYEILLDELRVPKSGQVTTLYWRTTEPQPSTRVLRAGAFRSSGAIRPMDHLPGDWLVPGDQWPVGALLRDQTLVRLTGKAEGTVTFTAGVVSRMYGKPIAPADSSLPTTKSGEVILGTAEYVKGSEGIWAHWPAPSEDGSQ